ncbi:MAG: RbsD/FucU domain-containing protein [Alistipes sp.]
MLKNIPSILSPELLKILMEMGHGDELVLGDANFPAASTAQRLVRADGHGGPELLEAILQLFPLDTFVAQPVSLMKVVPGDDYTPDLWLHYEAIICNANPQFKGFEMLERFEFYHRTAQAYAVVATGEMGRYANVILKKGIL